MTTKIKTIGKHELTSEMNNLIDAVLSGQSIKAYAYAGSGKSTVLRAVEKYHTGKSGLYICYNKSLEQEARKLFSGHNVHIATSHSFALNSFSPEERKNFIKKVGLKHSKQTVLAHSDLKDDSILCQHLDVNKVYKYILKTIDKFCLTASKEISEIHLPDNAIKAIDQLVKKKTIKATQRKEFYEHLVSHSQTLIKSMFNTNNDCPATHDCYLKLWQLSEPKIAYDYIMFDEAQDANPLLLSVILRQKCQQIFVGDKYQSIYQFRGGINAMDLIPYEGIELSRSFRFGQKVADLATKVLNHVDPKISIKGVGYDTDVVLGSQYDGVEPFLYLSHTNASLLEVLISCHQANVPATFLSNKAEYSLRKLNSMMRIAAGQESVLPTHKKYKSLEHLLLNEKDTETQLYGEWIEHDYPRARKLHDALVWSLNIPQSKATVQLSTAHGSKGLEHDVVMLSDDFKATITAFSKGKPLDESEINLLYVALTRPKKVLVLPDELMSALDDNLAFTLNKTKVDKAMLDNVLPPELKTKPARKSVPRPKKTVPTHAEPAAGNADQPSPTKRSTKTTKSTLRQNRLKVSLRQRKSQL
ncbi:DNA helicase [Vibrio sp. JCM 19236]|nr:DNA helicase [Vibrio sp. JCM 19236]